MEIASVVIEHGFDQEMLEQIDSLRTIRLNLAEKMLSDLDATAKALSDRGLADGTTTAELRCELEGRIKTLRDRVKRPDIVYSDEISLYADLLEQSLSADEDGDENGESDD